MRLFCGSIRYCTVIFAIVLLSQALAVLAQTAAPIQSAPTSGQSTSNNSAPAAPSANPAIPSAQVSHYQISPGDLLDVAVYDVPEISQKVRVSTEGDIYLPLINYVHIGGLTIDETQATLERALKAGNFMTSPHVSVSVIEYGSGVALMGEVAHPGIYPVLGSRHLLDVLSSAGGTTSTAGRVVTITHKDSPNAHQVVLLSNDPKKAMEANVEVYQGDTVIVTKAGVVYILGEVLQPSGIVMDDKTDYSVMKVLAMAHGPTKTAKLGQAKIVRRAPGGQLTDIPVALDKIIASKAPDVAMQADDILFVPISAGKTVAYRSLDGISSLATGVALLGATRGLP